MRDLARLILLLMMLLLTLFSRRNFHKERNIGFYVLYFAILSVIAASILSAPIENIFFRFPTLEQSFIYQSAGSMRGAVEGNSSALVVYAPEDHEENTETFIIPKDAEGWKVRNESTEKIVYSNTYGSRTIYIYTYGESKDYYAVVRYYYTVLSNSEIPVKDNRQTDFLRAESAPDKYGARVATYYAYIGDIAGYKISVGGMVTDFDKVLPPAE